MALLTPAFDSVYSHYVKKDHEASDLGIWEAMTFIVIAISTIVGGYLAKLFGFRILFVVMFLISMIGTLNSLKLLISKKYLNS